MGRLTHLHSQQRHDEREGPCGEVRTPGEGGGATAAAAAVPQRQDPGQEVRAVGGGRGGARPRRALALASHQLQRRQASRVSGRGLHSSTSQLNLSAFCVTGGAVRGCFGVFWMGGRGY